MAVYISEPEITTGFALIDSTIATNIALSMIRMVCPLISATVFSSILGGGKATEPFTIAAQNTELGACFQRVKDVFAGPFAV